MWYVNVNNIWTLERQQLIYFIVNMENVKDGFEYVVYTKHN